jgi:hypothetical protein
LRASLTVKVFFPLARRSRMKLESCFPLEFLGHAQEHRRARAAAQCGTLFGVAARRLGFGTIASHCRGSGLRYDWFVIRYPVGLVGAFLPFLVSTFAANLGCTKACTDAGCASIEMLRVTLPLSDNQSEPLEFTACRNDACWHGVLPELDVDWTIYARLGVSLEPDAGEEPAGVRGQAGVVREDNGSLSLEVGWQLDDYRDVAQGDALSIDIRDAQNANLMMVEEQVRDHQDYYPNGEDCDETPCRSTTIDRTEP